MQDIFILTETFKHQVDQVEIEFAEINGYYKLIKQQDVLLLKD